MDAALLHSGMYAVWEEDSQRIVRLLFVFVERVDQQEMACA
jgi:hypothetical protein